MFETLPVSRPGKLDANALTSFPVAASLHLLAIGSLVAASWLAIPPTADPPWRPVLHVIALPPPPPPPAAPLAGRAVTAPTPESVEPVIPEEFVQPQEIPELPPAVQDSGDVAGIEGGAPDGVPGGIVGGVPGGVAGGVPGGVLGGVVGSLLDGPGDEPEDKEIVWTPSMTLPVPIHRVEPRYPEMARRARLEGSVEVALLIAADGSVEEVQIIHGNPAFEREAVAAVRQWRFRPTVLNGRAVKLLYRVQIDFHLR